MPVASRHLWGAGKCGYSRGAALFILLIATTSASAASINDLRALGYRLLPDNASTIDVGDGDLVFKADAATREGVLELVEQLVRQGRGGGAWDGEGFVSSAAAANPLTRLVVTLNEREGGMLFSTIAGEAVDRNTVLVKYTWNGDIDLNGRVDADDYFRLDADFAAGRPTLGGDLNYDGKADADDYFLMDASFMGQTPANVPRAAKVYTLVREADDVPAAVPLPAASVAGMTLLGAMLTLKWTRRGRGA